MEGLLDPGNNREEGDGIPIQIFLVLKDGWTPPFAGTPNPIILGGLDPPQSNSPRLLGPLLGGWTPTIVRTMDTL